MVLNHVFNIFWFERPFLLTAIIIIVAVFYSKVFHLYIIIHICLLATLDAGTHGPDHIRDVVVRLTRRV